MLKSLYHNSFGGGSGCRSAYEVESFQPTEKGFARVTSVLSDYTEKGKVVPFTNFTASVLITSGKKLERVNSVVMGVDMDDVRLAESELSSNSDVESN